MIQTPDIQALNRWARRNGYNDFNTYIATGGNLISAAESLVAERSDVNRALAAINRYSPIPEQQAGNLATAQSPQSAEPWVPPGKTVEPVATPDPANAAVQGADA